MKIQSYADGCFLIENKDNAVVFNPGKDFEGVSVDVAMLSMPDPLASAIENAKKTLSLPGEYEISGILIRGFYSEDQKKVLYKVIFEGVAFVYLGFMEEKPSKEILKKLGENVEVLFLVLPGKYDTKMIRQTIEEIDPRVVYFSGHPAGFPSMVEQGAKIESDGSITLAKGDLNSDKTEMIILGE